MLEGSLILVWFSLVALSLIRELWSYALVHYIGTVCQASLALHSELECGLIYESIGHPWLRSYAQVLINKLYGKHKNKRGLAQDYQV